MTSMRRASLWVSYLLLLSASAGFAQSETTAEPSLPPAHLSIVEGQAFIDRESRSEAAVANLPLLDGDRVRTEEGRVEVILADGSLLHLDRYTTVDLMAGDLLRLLRGRVHVVVRGARDPAGAVRYQIDTPVASVQTGGPGEFRVSSAENSGGLEVELAVFRGQAAIGSDHGAQGVRAGECSIVREGFAPSDPQYFNSARWDEFDRWSAARSDERLGTVSTQYLPSELSVYASTFDQYGTWRYEADEGAVWYPTVSVGWRPYSVGYWGSYPAWGSFWIGSDPWAWPTHHYGHWGFSLSFGWYWRPAQAWGPAWVYWAYSPGYVSWCPLGRHGYPVFGHFGVHGHYYGNHVDPWRGWTVVPRQHFGRPMPVNRVAVDGNRLGPADRGAFAARREGPSQGRAVPRYAGAGTAVPRGGGMAVPRAGDGTTAPRAGGGRGLPDFADRPGPTEAARIFAGARPDARSTAVRRSFPASPTPGSTGQRTAGRSAMPDVAASGGRRDPATAARGSAGALTGTILDDGARARTYPRALPSAPSPSDTNQAVSRRRGAWTDAAQAPTQTNPYARGNSRTTPGALGLPQDPQRYSVPRYAQPTSEVPRYSTPQYSQPRSDTPRYSTPQYSQPRSDTPRYSSPQYSQPRSDAPRYSSPQSSQPRSETPRYSPAQPLPAARPRDGGGGIPSGSAVRRGGGPQSSSSPSSAPRYNPGSAAPPQRSGGSSPPPSRRRGGAPD